MIVYGWYSFDAECYTPEDLGLGGFLPGDELVVRQKIVHIFWIPIVPIGKVYALRRAGELYEVSADVNDILKSLAPHRTPFYSFLLPILIVLGFAIVGTYGFVEDQMFEYKYHNIMVAEHEQKTNQNVDIIKNHLDENVYFKLTKSTYLLDEVYAKVEKVEGDKVAVRKFVTDLSYKDEVSYLIQYSYLNQLKDFDELVWIDRKTLNKGVCKDYDSLNVSEEYGIDIFNDGELYLIDETRYIDFGPDIQPKGTGGYWEKLSVHLHNYGQPAELVEIENISGDINWTMNLPFHVPTNNYNGSFILNGDNYKSDNEYEVILHFQGSGNKEYKFRMKGKNVNPIITREF